MLPGTGRANAYRSGPVTVTRTSRGFARSTFLTSTVRSLGRGRAGRSLVIVTLDYLLIDCRPGKKRGTSIRSKFGVKVYPEMDVSQASGLRSEYTKR